MTIIISCSPKTHCLTSPLIFAASHPPLPCVRPGVPLLRAAPPGVAPQPCSPSVSGRPLGQPALRNPPQRPLPHPRLHLWSWPACMGRHLPALLGPRLLSAHFHPESLGPLRSGKPLRQSLGSHWVCIQGHPGESHSCRGAHSKAAKWNEARKVWSGRKLGGRGGAGLDPHRWLHPAGHQAAP